MTRRQLGHRTRDRRIARVLAAVIGSALAASALAGCAPTGGTQGSAAPSQSSAAAQSPAAAPSMTPARTPDSSPTAAQTSGSAKSSAASGAAAEIPRDALPEKVGGWEYYNPVNQPAYKKGDKQLLIAGPISQSDTGRARSMFDNVREFEGGFCGELGKRMCHVTLGKSPDVTVTVAPFKGDASMDELVEFSKGLAAR